LDTRLTHSRQSYNKDRLAEQLDQIATNVSKRGIFVVSKNVNGFYDIINYVDKSPVIRDLPAQTVANTFCERYNKGVRLREPDQTRRVAQILLKVAKLSSDCMYYTHTQSITKDNVKAEIAAMRKHNARAHIVHLCDELNRELSQATLPRISHTTLNPKK
jgi:hypothetical protein